ncbi:MAG: hypothetical protein HF978_18010 [Desulfobacteraceae bacterium]|nr:super-infection exclusion protein B [Desulfobacteraceae bacterium]MBC2757443.1 hypothetical protein [Desulfobacteraceae bacterium]
MKHCFFKCAIFLSLLILSAAFADADIIILKNGQVIKDVTIKDEGDTLYCENNDQSFYINKNTVENIIRTGPKTGLKTFPEKAKDFITSLPRKIRLFIKDYFAFVATVTGVLVLLAGLIVFKILWINISPIFKEGARRRDVIKAVRQLDADEKSVLREFYIQQANTLEMPMEDIVVSGLIKKGILQTTREKGQYSVGGLLLPVIISPVAKKRIKPRKIGMPSNLNDPKVRDALSKSRPQYMYEMAGFYKSLEKSNSDRL